MADPKRGRDSVLMVTESLLDSVSTLLGDGDDTGRAAAPVSAAQVLPTLLGWQLDIPRGRACTFNFVSVYKQRGLVPDATDQQAGWDACKRLDQLKAVICQAGAAAPLDTLVEYAALISAARQHIATNEGAFVYDNEVLPASLAQCPELDYEAYMTLSHLAARDVTRAQQARRLDTQAALTAAASLYARAAWFLDTIHADLYAKLPPSERVRHYEETDWIMALAPPGVTRGAAGALVTARAALLRAEASLCLRRALEFELASDEYDDLRGAVLDGTAEYCARLFSNITQALGKHGGANARISRYAAVTACRLQLSVAARLAETDIVLAESASDALALARALRRLDHSVLPLCTAAQRAVVAPDVQDALDQVQMRIVELRARCDRLRYDASGAFAVLDMTTSMTQPTAPDLIDPASPDGSPVPGVDANADVQEVARMRAAFAVSHQRFVAFFALRVAHARAMHHLNEHRALPGEGAMPGIQPGFGDFDLLFKRITEQLLQLPPERRAALSAEPQMFLEMLQTAFTLGALGERDRFLAFMFAGDDGTDPDAPIVKDIRVLQQTKLNAARYLHLLAEGAGAPS